MILDFKRENGITMVTLVLTIILLIIISSTIVFYSLSSVDLNKLNNMYADLQLIQDKVDIYYAENGELPVYDNDIQSKDGNDEIFGIDPAENDGAYYYRVNLGDIGIQSDDLKHDDVYYVNDESHIVYCEEGVEFEGKDYHRLNSDYKRVATPTPIPASTPTPTPAGT